MRRGTLEASPWLDYELPFLRRKNCVMVLSGFSNRMMTPSAIHPMPRTISPENSEKAPRKKAANPRRNMKMFFT